MKKMQKGFTLIELMIVIASIAILAAIALPAYQDYTVRAKMAEVITAADACKVSVTEFWESRGVFPPSAASAGCNNQVSKYVASVAVTPATGVITSTTSTDAGLPTIAQTKTVVLTPTPSGAATVTTDTILNWACSGTVPAKYLPGTCR